MKEAHTLQGLLPPSFPLASKFIVAPTVASLGAEGTDRPG